MTNQPKEPFEELPFPRKDMAGMQAGRYRVYKNPKDYVLVEAVSALEALQNSKLDKPYRVERDMLHLTTVLTLSSFSDGATQEPTGDAPQQVEESAAAPASPEAPAADSNLSNDDVSKLLNDNPS